MYRVLSALAGLALGGCAAEPAPVVRYAGASESLALQEARAIEAARRHPNAQPRARPEYPEQAPPPLPAGMSLPPPLYLTRRSEPYPDYPASSSVVVERESYSDAPYGYAPRYGFGMSYPYGYGYGDPYGYGYGYPRYGYGFGHGLGLGLGIGVGVGARYRPGLGAPRYHFNSGFGHSLHVRSFGGGFRHHR